MAGVVDLARPDDPAVRLVAGDGRGGVEDSLLRPGDRDVVDELPSFLLCAVVRGDRFPARTLGGRRDVEGSEREAQPPVEIDGRVVRGARATSVGEGRGHDEFLVALRRPTKRVDTPEHRVQPALGDPTRHRALVPPDRAKLRDRHLSMLPATPPRQLLVRTKSKNLSDSETFFDFTLSAGPHTTSEPKNPLRVLP